MKKAIELSEQAGAKGIKIQIAGRLGGKDWVGSVRLVIVRPGRKVFLPLSLARVVAVFYNRFTFTICS